MQFLKKLIRKDKGQGMVEYGIILGLVSVATIAAVTLMGTDIGGVFTTIEGALAALPGA
jgi:pilus assembly protein Flp/PilA